MMIEIPQLLSAQQLQHCREALEAAQWTDGKLTAGHNAVSAKNNLQLPPESQTAQELGNLILNTLGQNPLFVAATLPLKVLPPLFNCYQNNGDYGNHVDNAIRSLPGMAHKLRTDISCTLFFSQPDEYEGGELVVEDTFGTRGVKLPAGHVLVYPGSSVHRVNPVTRGSRFAAFFWVQSFVRSDSQRRILLELDTAIQQLTAKLPTDPALVQLTGVYHNLLRQWADT